MTLENEKEVSEDVTETKSVEQDAKAMGIELAKAFKEEMKKGADEAKKAVEQEIPAKIAKTSRIETPESTRPCGSFKNEAEMKNFAKAFVPKMALMQFDNEKALTTYQNIGTDADGGSFDPIAAQGLLADSVARHNSYVEDTLNVRIFNSVGTFIDHTQDSTAYMISESVAGTESKPQNITRTITQKKIMVLSPVTNETFRFGTLADIASETFDSMSRAIAIKKQHLIFAADGDADTTDGGITGVIPAIEDVSNNSTIYNVGGAGFGNISNTDISNIVSQVSDYANAENYAWYCHKNVWGSLEALARTLGGATYTVQTGQKPIPSLFGYPVKFVNSSMASSYSTDVIGLLFGDLKAMIATGTDGKTYVDSSQGFYFDQDTTALRVIEHIGVNVYQPGTNGTTGSVIAVRFQDS